MARRYLTTAVQRTGYIWMMKRLTRAFGRRDVRDIEEPLSAQAAVFKFGLAAIGIVGIGAVVVGLIMPAGKAGTATFVVLDDGGRYVKYADQWHSVPNLASARLILNSPAEAKKVEEKELRSAPLGPAMGIPFAPDSLTVTDSDFSQWSVCSAQSDGTSASSASEKDVVTTVVGGTGLNSQAHRLMGNEATLVVTPESKGAYWLLFNDHRALIADEPEVWNALGISDENRKKATVTSAATLNAIPQYPTIEVPALERMDMTSTALDRWSVGSVLRSQVGNEITTYVVADDGVQIINEVVARLLINSGANEYRDASMTVISRAKSVKEVNPEQFPTEPPLVMAGKTVCSTWEQKGAEPSQSWLSISDALPLDDDQVPVELLPSAGAPLSADSVFMPAGENWLVMPQGAGGTAMPEAQEWFVTPNGVRYAVGQAAGSASPRGALGFGEATAVPVPWSVAQLLNEGAQLSFSNALAYRDNAYDSPYQKPAPREGGE